MRHHEGTTLVACEIYPVTKTMEPSHTESRNLPLYDLSTLPISAIFRLTNAVKGRFLSVIKPRKVFRYMVRLTHQTQCSVVGFRIHYTSSVCRNFLEMQTYIENGGP